MFKNAKNPKWSDAAHSSIIFDVVFIDNKNDEFEAQAFVANPTDCTSYGQMLYYFALNGLFGHIADSDEELMLKGEMPIPADCEIQDGKIVYVGNKEKEAQAELDRRIGELMTLQMRAKAELDPQFAETRKAALQALLECPQQLGWPKEVTWPESPLGEN